MPERFADKVALITGAGSGIGAACARRLAVEGAALLLADRDREAAEAVAATLREDGHAVRVAGGDVGLRGDAVAMVAAAESAFGGLDVLINSAGITRRNLPADTDFEAAWDEVMRVNLKGTLLMCHAAVVAMRRRGAGSIVNLSSIMGLRTYHHDLGLSDGFNPYPHSKGGVLQMTRDLAVNLAPRRIRVNAVCPGFIHSALTAGITGNEALHQRVAARHPLGRLGEPHEVAAVIAFLASDEASFVTAAAWTVDGGYTAC